MFCLATRVLARTREEPRDKTDLQFILCLSSKTYTSVQTDKMGGE
jgi:hypothetical protein